MLKKVILFALSALLILSFSLFSCMDNLDDGKGGKPDEHHENDGDKKDKPEKEKINTAKDFYKLVADSETFWFKMEITSNGETYLFTQATNGKSITSILDYENDSDDRYEIIEFKDGLANVHTLDLSEKKYDTAITKNYQTFLFDGEKPENYANPSQKGDSKNYQGYYCEKFETASESGGKVSGFNAYYFNNDRLQIIEITENGVITMTMKLLDYGKTIPDNILLSPPADFLKGKLEIDTTIDFGSLGWE